MSYSVNIYKIDVGGDGFILHDRKVKLTLEEAIQMIENINSTSCKANQGELLLFAEISKEVNKISG